MQSVLGERWFRRCPEVWRLIAEVLNLCFEVSVWWKSRVLCLKCEVKITTYEEWRVKYVVLSWTQILVLLVSSLHVPWRNHCPLKKQLYHLISVSYVKYLPISSFNILQTPALNWMYMFGQVTELCILTWLYSYRFLISENIQSMAGKMIR